VVGLFLVWLIRSSMSSMTPVTRSPHVMMPLPTYLLISSSLIPNAYTDHVPATSLDCTDHILATLKLWIKSLSISKTFRQTRHHKSNLRVTSNVIQYRYKTVYFWWHSSHNIWRESGANQLTEVYFRNNWTSQWCSCVGLIVEAESITDR